MDAVTDQNFSKVNGNLTYLVHTNISKLFFELDINFSSYNNNIPGASGST